MNAQVLGLEKNSGSGFESCRDEILHDLVLAVHGDGTAAGELAQGDAVTHAVELEVESLVDEPFAIHPVADAERAEQVDGSLLQHARANPPDDVVTAALFQDDGVDACQMEQVAKQKARRAGADDANLRPRGVHV